jgi:hypothetical protein
MVQKVELKSKLEGNNSPSPLQKNQTRQKALSAVPVTIDVI